MLRVYRAPDRVPGQVTLLADAGTWAAVIAALRAQRDQASIERATRLSGAVARAGKNPVLRVALPAADAMAVLALAGRA